MTILLMFGFANCFTDYFILNSLELTFCWCLDWVFFSYCFTLLQDARFALNGLSSQFSVTTCPEVTSLISWVLFWLISSDSHSNHLLLEATHRSLRSLTDLLVRTGNSTRWKNYIVGVIQTVIISPVLCILMVNISLSNEILCAKTSSLLAVEMFSNWLLSIWMNSSIYLGGILPLTLHTDVLSSDHHFGLYKTQ